MRAIVFSKMESSSIVSFNNDSTFQSTLKGEYNNVSVHELALHAMRDRCLLLQRRINTLESDNMRLKLDVTKAAEGSPYIPIQDDEKFKLQQKIAELNKQKSQLMHHIFMVSCENKNLWNKISSLKGPDKPKQPLLRTSTYIHSTPKSSSNCQYSEPSLEEISLKLINSYIQEKSQLVEQYEQMTQLENVEEDILNVDSIGFAFIEDPVTDSLKEIHIQTEKMQQMKRELAQQEKDLQLILSRVEAVIKEGYKCPTCQSKNTKVTIMEDKQIETSDSLTNVTLPITDSHYEENYNSLRNSKYKQEPETTESTENEELTDKMCPMCGQTFTKETSFIQFQSHVENHFTGDIDPDSIVENNFDVQSSFDNVL